MGGYMSTPNIEKVSVDKTFGNIAYGASSMQGWRISQEDAHNCCPDFEVEDDTSLFAVYDGHGGAEVAEYTAQHFPDFLKALSLYKDGNLSKALEEAFLSFDATLTKDDVIETLKELAGVNLEEQDPEERDEEVKNLTEEAELPIEKLMEKFGYKIKDSAAAKLAKKEGKFQSPAIRSKKTSQTNGDHKEENDCKEDLSSKLLNGQSDSKDNNCENETNEEDEAGSTCKKENSEKSEVQDEDKSFKDSVIDTEKESSFTAGSSADKDARDVEDKSVASAELPGCSGDGGSGAGGSGTGSSSAGHIEVGSSSEAGGSGGSSSAGGSGAGSSSEAGGSGAGGSVTSGSAGEGPGSSSGRMRHPRRGVIPESDEDETSMSEEETTDEEDEDSESVQEKDSEDEVEYDEEEEGDYEDVMTGGEEPGVDSGCTAVVAVKRGNQLYVANAGDSRCVVGRDGKAVEMSFDHKPEDELERKRIETAGGWVTPDGRVKGGLNLSRALGDHCYKQNEDLPQKEQMITALPDIKSITMTEKDEFMVLACDGIWNVLDSQQVVTFVHDRIHGEMPALKLSNICEELFDVCLAPDTTGDGTGCDNMTCIIVRFTDIKPSQAGDKRPAESSDDNKGEETGDAKRPKLTDVSDKTDSTEAEGSECDEKPS